MREGGGTTDHTKTGDQKQRTVPDVFEFDPDVLGGLHLFTERCVPRHGCLSFRRFTL